MKLHSQHWLCVLASPVYAAITNAHPEAAPPAPQVTPAAVQAAQTYPTTKTIIWSTTKTSLEAILWINQRVVTHKTTITVTELEPGPVTAPFPATVTQTVVSHVTYDDTSSYILGSGITGSDAIGSSMSSFVATVEETWIVSPPGPSDLPVGTSADSLPCENAAGCASGSAKTAPPDPVCDAAGLRTGCLTQQCSRKGDGDGQWWCYRMWQRDYVRPYQRMGRACWGGQLEFRQLNVPCVDGDVAVACLPCQGTDVHWGAVNWTGPGQ